MIAFLKDVIDRIDKVNLKKAKELDIPIKEGEEIIGEIPEDVRAVWVAREEIDAERRELLRKARHLIIDVADDNSKWAALDDLSVPLDLLTDQYNTLSGIFWGGIHTFVKVKPGTATIGIRKGWKIVSCPADSEDAILRLGLGLVGALPIGAIRI